MERRGRKAARRGTRGKRMREKVPGPFFPFFAPAGRRRFLKRRKDTAEHHKKEDFRSELLRMLRAHGVEFDERYVFD